MTIASRSANSHGVTASFNYLDNLPLKSLIGRNYLRTDGQPCPSVRGNVALNDNLKRTRMIEDGDGMISA